MPPLPHRRPSFGLGTDTDPRWHTHLPELACVANSVSLLMPYAEPYVIRSIRRASERAPEPARGEIEAYLRQEASHHRAHRDLNAAIVGAYPGAARLERAMAWMFCRLQSKRSLVFNAGFAAGFETVAYATARWVERHRRELFDHADPLVRDLFIWHLAEEVEHKSVAFDVYRTLGGSRLRYAGAMIASLAILAAFTVAGSIYLLARERRIWRPVCWFRLIRWSLGYCFELLPTMFASALPRHHPSQLSDPAWYELWLAEREAGEQRASEPAPRLR